MSLPAGTYAPFSITYLDAGNEISSFSGFSVDLTAGNFAAQQTLFTALVTATDAITLGARKKTMYGNEVLSSAVVPINGAAREIKLLVQWQSVGTGRRGVVTVPTVDPAIPDYVQNVNAKDAILLSSPTEIADFISAFEDFVVDPVDAGAITVIGLRVVGRNI